MVYFVGAGSGAVDLITVRGKNADPGLQELPDILVSPGVAAPSGIFAGQVVH